MRRSEQLFLCVAGICVSVFWGGCGKQTRPDEGSSGGTQKIEATQNVQSSSEAGGPSNRSYIVVHKDAHKFETTQNLQSSIESSGQTQRPYKSDREDADYVAIDGKEYSFAQVMADLPKVLRSTNNIEKTQWLHRIVAFRTKFQGDGVSLLMDAFRREPNPKVREAIVHVIRYSRDERFDAFCLSAANDSNPMIRLFAADAMLKQNNKEAVEVIAGAINRVECCGKLQREVWDLLTLAIEKFGLPFTVDESAIPKDLSESKKLEARVAQWNKWWNENRAIYNLQAR